MPDSELIPETEPQARISCGSAIATTSCLDTLRLSMLATAAASAKKVGKHGGSSNQVFSTSKQMQSEVTADKPAFSSYKVLLPDDVTVLVTEVPTGAKVLKSFGSMKQVSSPGREG